MIPKEQVKYIAKLARIFISEKETEKMRKELSAILKYIDLLKEVDIKKIKPTFHPFSFGNKTREDKVKEKSFQMVSKLIELIPEKENGYVKVKAILK